MYVEHGHAIGNTAKEKERKLADTTYVIQLTALKKCCNITKVIAGNIMYILRTRILAYKYAKCIL